MKELATTLFPYMYLKSMQIQKVIEDGQYKCDVQLILAKALTEHSEALIVSFSDVVELVVGDLNQSTCCLLEIRNIASWGLEGIKYRVYDTEPDQLSLSCRAFSISPDGIDFEGAGKAAAQGSE